MAIEITIQVGGEVVACVSTDAPYSPDVAEDLLRRTRETALAVYADTYVEIDTDLEPDPDDEPA